MHARALLHRWLKEVFPLMHGTRLRALEAIIGGAFIGGRLTVTSLGRSIKGGAKEKHKIKRADRLLSNRNLQADRKEIYASLCKEIIGKAKRPIILIDWSDVDERRKFFLLKAATPINGRSLTLYEEVHEFSTKERRITHSKFLEQLRQLLPKGCKPIIITDAGFRTPWFKQVKALGWDFVGRVRNVERIQCETTCWVPAKSLYLGATNKVKFLGKVLLTESNPLLCHIVLFKEKAKGRVCLTKKGFRARSRRSMVNATRNKEPWLLATSLEVTSKSAKLITKLYSTRMQIEETFRDLKCTRYGLSLYYNGTYKLERLSVLILIGTLTNVFALLLGAATKERGMHMQFQANTVKKHSVLSAVFLGVQVFRDFRLTFSFPLLQKIKKLLHQAVYQYSCQ